MTIAEKNPTIFEQLQVLKADCKIFTIAEGVDFDDLYIFRYGYRSTLDDLDSSKVAKYCKMMYCDKWDSAYDLIVESHKLMVDLGNMKSTVITREYGYTDTIGTLESVPAFDVEQAELDRQTDRTLSHIEDKNKTTTLSDNKDLKDFNTAYNTLMRDLIDNIVFADLNKLITYRLRLD